MKLTQETRRRAGSRGERGGSRLNLLIVLLVIAVAGYAISQYAPVAYKAVVFKDFMQETVNKAAYPPGQTNTWVEAQLRAAAREHDLPQDMYVNVQNQDGHIVARAQWTQPVNLPGYIYYYEFDHTARSSGFINPK
jgi:hypothetical protein